jgi:hypothetical protein
MMDERDEITHESFGMVGISRVQGQTNLVGMDFPVQSFITLKIHEARLERNLSRNWWFAGKLIAEIHMSETQFASMIMSPNQGSGVPCTLDYVREGPGKNVADPPKHMIDIEGLKSEVSAQAEEARVALNALQDKLSAMANGGSVSKAAVRDAQGLLQAAMQHAGSNLKFREEQGVQAIQKAAEKAKMEVAAYADVLLHKSGLAALAQNNGALDKPLEIEGNG